MTKIIFGGKMFFLGTTRIVRNWLRPLGITPARFNMLVAIATKREGIPQHDLLDLLGVTSPTICRMVHSLEELGLVVRTPHPRNSRHWWLKITTVAMYKLREAIADVVDSSELTFAIARMFNDDPEGESDGDMTAVRAADSLLSIARESFLKQGSLEFPYDNDAVATACAYWTPARSSIPCLQYVPSSYAHQSPANVPSTRHRMT